tara:strand:+ start:982 stop:1254 length:273 start_codon:yes stop_codon:yes gene_type:complete
MNDVSSAVHFHFTTPDGHPESFSLKEAIETIQWQAERELDSRDVLTAATLPQAEEFLKSEVEAVVTWLNICEKHQRDMFERIYAFRQYGP